MRCEGGVVALVRQLAVRSGSSQTAAVEDAVERRLSDLNSAERARAKARHEAADDVLRQLHRFLTDDDRRALRESEADLYDDHGLPR